MGSIRSVFNALAVLYFSLPDSHASALPAALRKRNDLNDAYNILRDLGAPQFCSSLIHLHDVTSTVSVAGPQTTSTILQQPCTSTVPALTTTITATKESDQTFTYTSTVPASTVMVTSSVAGQIFLSTTDLAASTTTDIVTLAAQTSTATTDLPASVETDYFTESVTTPVVVDFTTTDASVAIEFTATASVFTTTTVIDHETVTLTVDIATTSTNFVKRQAESTNLPGELEKRGRKCNIPGIPGQGRLDRFVCDIIKEACSELYQPHTTYITQTGPATVHTTQAPKSCVTSVPPQSTMTLQATSTSQATVTISTQAAPVTATTIITGPAVTSIATSQLPEVVVDSTFTPDAVVVTSTSQLPPTFLSLTSTLTFPSTSILTIEETATASATSTLTDVIVQSATITTFATRTSTVVTATATTTALFCNVNAFFNDNLNEIFFDLASTDAQCKQQCLSYSNCNCGVWADVAQQCYGFTQSCPQVVSHQNGITGFILNDRNCP